MRGSNYTTYSRQKFSGLCWMVKRYYIQDYPENFKDNTKTRTIASDFIRPPIESRLTRREKKMHIKHVVRAGGFLQVVIKVRKLQCHYQKMEAFNICACYMIKFMCYSCFQLWARWLDTLRTPHNTHHHSNKEVVSYTAIVSAIGKRPTNSKK